VKRALAVVGLAVAGAVAVPAPSHAASGAPVRQERPSRVLVVSLPALTWADLRAHRMPNLERLLSTSAVADLTTRAVSRRTTLGDGYTTLGAGTRAAGVPGVDGFGFGVGEQFGTDSAAAVYRLRTGRAAPDGIVNLSIADLVDRNDSLLYDAHIGALGDALSRAGYQRAVIANGDGAAPITTPSSYRRQAVAALMDHDGRVPAGRVDAGLLRRDPDAPFGLRLDQDAVVAAFDAAWRDRSVVMVEASDLVREDAYQESVVPSRRDVVLDRSLDTTDRLVGAILSRVDLTRDAVLVVGPAHSASRIGLTVAALHAPGIEAGLLRSGTTRRDGFVQLVDVAPTILDRLDIARPDFMEGRPFEVVASGSTLSSRAASLARADHAASFRDSQTPIAASVYIWSTVALVVVALGVITVGRGGARAVEVAALALLGFLPLTYLAGLARFDDAGVGPYWAFLAVGSAVIGAALSLLRRRELDPLLAALGLVVGLLTIDIVLGGRLQFNTAFGYSPIVAGRFQGMGNLAYSMYASAGVLLAGLLAFRVRRGQFGNRAALARRVALAVVVIIVLVDGLPFWGADVGGVLSLVPAVGVFAMVLYGRRVRLRVLAAWIGGAIVALVGVGLLDLTRAPSRRTHLGRLLEKIGTGDFAGFTTVIERKLHANLSVLTSMWVVLVPVTFTFLAVLVFVRPHRFELLQTRIPELRAALAGLAVVVVLGFAFNDSGIAVPGMMFGVTDAALVYLVARTADRRRLLEPDPTAAELAELTGDGSVASVQAHDRPY
jgi:hypothetical protein